MGIFPKGTLHLADRQDARGYTYQECEILDLIDDLRHLVVACCVLGVEQSNDAWRVISGSQVRVSMPCRDDQCLKATSTGRVGEEGILQVCVLESDSELVDLIQH